MSSDRIQVNCRHRDCGAQYDQGVGVDARGRDVRATPAAYQATLPTTCGVCGSPSIVLSPVAIRRQY